jgi:hypothetical protein
MENVLVKEQSLKDIASAIRDKANTDATYTPGEMAEAIGALKTEFNTEPITVTENGVYQLPEGVDGFSSVTVDTKGIVLPDEAYLITGDCNNMFSNNKWAWYIDLCGDKITTKDITKMASMFTGCSITNIPFDLNCKEGIEIDLSFQFNQCNNLTSIPKINGYCKPSALNDIFANCYRLKNIPENIATWFDWSIIDNSTSAYKGDFSTTFNHCYSLRKIPMSFYAHGNPIGHYGGSIYYGGFQYCYVLDEVIDLPNPHKNVTWTNNAFFYTFHFCSRLKNMTFATPDGAPYVVKWKSQTIDLSNYVGYANQDSDITGYNSGITADKKVTDDASYQALKNDSDWYTTSEAYSRYNHDSAVATINSLPDASAYLATAGGTNTIKFKGAAGSKTDGGAINTLTEEEIAVATAKGWTVTFA